MIRKFSNHMLTVSLIMGALFVPQAVLAQNTAVSDTIRTQGLSSLEEGRLLFFGLNRTISSTRARAMGGAGVSIRGSNDMYSLNPANVLGATRPELISHGTVLNGSSTVNGAPSTLLTGTGKDDMLEVSQYRVTSSIDFDYADLSFGLPITLFGGRGSVGLAYQRHRLSAQRNEVRFQATGRAVGDQAAIVGVSNKPDGGYDAFTGTIAREMFSWMDLGVNFNFQTGTLRHETSSGISAEFPVAKGSSDWEQDFDAFNVDLGTRLALGKLSLGGVVYLGHDLEYKDSEMVSFPFPDLEAPFPTTVRFERQILGHTQSVPTTLGFGGSYTWKRFTVTGDMTVTPWSESKITRKKVTADWFHSIPEDSTKFNYVLNTHGDSTETFSAKLDDSSSLRLGLEFIAYNSENIQVPLWVGYRKETLTTPNVQIPEQFKNFEQLILDNWKYNVDGQTPPEGVDPAQIEADLVAALESNQFLFNTPGSDASTLTFGAGITIGQVTFDMAVDHTTWDATRFYFEPFDARLQRASEMTSESLSSTTVTVGAKMTF